jgi:hypothetical protein
MKTRKLIPVLVLSLLTVLPGMSGAEIVGLEGPISAVTKLVDCGLATPPDTITGTITVMGVTVNIPCSAVIKSPTAALNINQLRNPTPLPGRSPRRGFLGGTAIINGATDVAGVPVADDVFVEPAENVMIGPVTAGIPFSVLGTEVVQLTDLRIPSTGAFNQFGFEVDLATVPVGALASVEGYFGSDLKLYAFLIETTGGTLVNPAAPQVSIQRAQCGNRAGVGTDLIRVFGGAVIPEAALTPGRVTFITVDAAGNDVQTVGSVRVIRDPANPPFGTYTFRANDLTLTDNVCQPRVKAVYRSTSATADMDAI